MRVVLPPGQILPMVSATVSVSRAEASELQEALELVLATGRSDWNVYVFWGEFETDLTLMLEMAEPRNTLDPV